MINKSKHPGMNYLSRISALVMAACILLAFTLKPKKVVLSHLPINLEKKIRVIIDAGHGGTDNGSIGGTLLEKDLSLQIASQVKSLNKTPNIEVILTRESDVFMNVREKLDFSLKQNADLFISIHVNAAPPVKENDVYLESSKSGFDAYISKNNTTLTEYNLRLATILLQNMSNFYSTNNKINIRDHGIWVLDENNVPAVMLECGYITNSKDRDFISNPANQKTIAENILKSVEQYISGDMILNKAVDTLPKKSTSAKKPANVTDNTVTPVNPSVSTTRVSSASAAQSSAPTVAPTKVTSASTVSPVSPTVAPTKVSSSKTVSPVSPTVAPSKVSPTNVSTSVNTHVESDINTSVNNNIQSNVSTSVNSNVNTVTSTSNTNHQSAKTISTKNTSNSQNTNVSSNHEGVISVSSTSPGSQIQVRANQGTSDSSLQLKITGPEPLYIVDGVVTSKSLVNNIDPNKISSIDILKGDAAIKYGDNGKNGVVIITTKK